MTNESRGPKRTGDNKSPTANLLWSALIFVMAAVFVGVWMLNATTYEIAYTDLLRLVEQRRSSLGAAQEAASAKQGSDTTTPAEAAVRAIADAAAGQGAPPDADQPTGGSDSKTTESAAKNPAEAASSEAAPAAAATGAAGRGADAGKGADAGGAPAAEIQELVVDRLPMNSGELTDPGQILVRQSDQLIFYSDVRDIRFGRYDVTGKVLRKEERPGGGPVAHAQPTLVRFRTNLGESDDLKNRLSEALLAAGIPFAHEPGPSIWQSFLPMLIITLLFIAFFFFMLRRLGGANSPMAFGRSRGRLYAQEDLGVSFNDAAGIDEAVEEVKEIVDFLKSPEKYQRLGGRIPRGVLLVGPPGTGKTLLAKAIAGEAGVPFFSLSGSDFVEMFVGVGAARVRDMFQQAEAKAPCIIFIDELDALGKTRGTSIVGGHDEREQTLNALLVEMDGFDSNSGVIVMAATNRPETLDQALLRPGRFDRQVLVDRPDVRGRLDILNVHVKNVKLDPTVQLENVAQLTPGFVGADLANLVNEAALLAARKNKSTVGMDEFNEGIERVTAGLEKKQRVMKEDEKYRVAYHEAGHALVAYSLPDTDPVHKVSIIPRGFAALGYTLQRPDGDRYLMTQGELESRIQVLLAGTVAEELVFHEVSTGAQNDLERCTDIARSMVMDYGMSRMGRVTFRETNRSAFLTGSGDERLFSHSEETAREIDREVKRLIDESLDKVRDILQTRRDALIALAERLMEVESIDATELQRTIEAHSPGPRVVPGTGLRNRQNRAAATPIDELANRAAAAVEPEPNPNPGLAH